MKRLFTLLMVFALALVAMPVMPSVAQADPVVARLTAYNSALPKGYNVIKVEDLVTRLTESKPVLLDVREVEEFTAGHIEGSINVPIRTLMQNLNLLPDLDAEVVVICKGGFRAAMAMGALQIVGYTKAFTLSGGYDAWVGAEMPAVTESVAPAAGVAPKVDEAVLKAANDVLANLPKGYGGIAPKDLAAELVEAEPVLIDVRSKEEWDKGYIKGAIHLWINEFMQGLDKLPADKNAKIVVYCAAGYRGGIVKVMMGMLGYTDVRNISGGLNAWVKSQLPLEGAPAAAAFNLDMAVADYLKAQPDTFGALRVADLAAELKAKPELFLLDVRTADEFAEGHLANALNVPLYDVLKNLDKLPGLDTEIVVYCGSGHRSALVMSALQMLGYKNVRSLLTGVGGWKQAELALVTEPAAALKAGTAPAVNAELLKLLDAYISAIPKGYNAIKPADLSVALAETKPLLIDVRGDSEWGGGRIEGAVHIPLRDLAVRMSELPADKAAAIVLYDNPTHRSSMAMVILGLKGYTNVKVLGGGFGAWQKANLPVVK